MDDPHPHAGDALVTLLDLAAVLSNFTSLTTRETP